MNRIAECCCGKIKLELNGDPEMNGVCSCSNCKKRTGSAFGISAYFKEEQIVSKPSIGLSVYKLHNKEQNHDQERYFCTSCGTTLFWYISTFTNMIGVAGGCFISNPLPEPSVSFNHKQKVAWATFSDSCEVAQ